MFEQVKRRQDYYMKSEILKEIGEQATGKEVLDYLIGDSEYNYDYDYVVYKYEYSKKSFFNRLNMLWVYPLFLISVPFRWIISGNIGVKRNSKLGIALEFLVGFE